MLPRGDRRDVDSCKGDRRNDEIRLPQRQREDPAAASSAAY
jgi:hypothetical protein